MSKISADNISNKDDTLEVPVLTVIAGSAKAWVNFNGIGVVAINDSFNVTSITDNGTGDYTVNFTVSMPDTNYASSGMAEGNAANVSEISRTTGGIRINTENPSSNVDLDSVSVITYSN